MRIRIANRDARRFVEHRMVFSGSNLFSEVRSTILAPKESLYIVYSYGTHWPLLLCSSFFTGDERVHVWVGNSDKYSRSTTRHMSLCVPHGEEILWVPRTELLEVQSSGYAGYVKKRLEGRVV